VLEQCLIELAGAEREDAAAGFGLQLGNRLGDVAFDAPLAAA
jgi:hypothetical protein